MWNSLLRAWMQACRLSFLLWFGPLWARVSQLVRGSTDTVQYLNPYRVQGFSDRDLLTDLFEGLVVFQAGPKVVGGAADAWQCDESRTRWEFHIRDNACWSDGTPLLAQDFVRSWNALCRGNVGFLQKQRLAQFLAHRVPLENSLKILSSEAGSAPLVLGVWAEGPKRLCLKLEHPVREALLLQCLADVFFFPISEEHLTRVAEWDSMSSEARKQFPLKSNGQYCLRAWDPRVAFHLKVNPFHHAYSEKRPYFDEVIYRVNQSECALADAFALGNIDCFSCSGFSKVSPGKFAQNLFKIPQSAFKALVFNCQQAKFKPLEIREAFNLLLDREGIQKSALPGLGEATYGLLPPSLYPDCAQRPLWASESFAVRKQKAAQLLERLGYTPQNPFKAEIIVQFEDDMMLKLLSSLLHSIPHLKIQFFAPERHICTQRLRDRQFEIFLGGFLVCPVWDPAVYFELHGPPFCGETEGTLSQFSDPVYAQALETIFEAELSREAYRRLLHELEGLHLQHMPSLPLVHLVCEYVLSPSLKRPTAEAGFPSGTLPSAWLSK